jgi:hypothetical protein
MPLLIPDFCVKSSRCCDQQEWVKLAHVAMLKKNLLVDSTLLLTIVIDDDDVEDVDGPFVRVAVTCNS